MNSVIKVDVNGDIIAPYAIRGLSILVTRELVGFDNVGDFKFE